jgi:DegV family protein with EDD domain
MVIRVIGDSTLRLNPLFVQEHQIEVIPLHVIIDGKTYFDGVNITLEEILNAREQGHKVSTSQPSPEAFLTAFQKCKEEGATDILCVTISSTLSGTYNSATLAASEMTGVNIHLFDSLSTSIGSEMLMKLLVEQLDLGKTVPEAIEMVKPYRENSTILMAMENLDAIYKSGRLSRIKATIGNLLRVKPIIEYIKGKNHVNSKFRTEKAIVSYIIDRIKIDYAKAKNHFYISISHVRALDKVNHIKQVIEEVISSLNITVSLEISPVVAINLGYGGFGIGWCHD